MKIDPQTLADLLHRCPVGRLATVTPEGEPHVLPVVFVADGDRVYSPVDAKRKSGRRLARVRNVEAQGRAALLLDHYEDDWSRLWWVKLEGAAWVERRDRELLERIGDRLKQKYPQYRRLAPFAGDPTLLVLRWQRVTGWRQTLSVAEPFDAPQG